MATRKSVSISISPELLAFAEGMLVAGRYKNISEVARAAFRLLEERELEFVSHRDRQLSRHAHKQLSV